MDWIEEVEKIFVDEFGKKISNFLLDKEQISGSDLEKWEALFQKIAAWKDQYLVKSEEITLYGVDGWYMDSVIEEFSYAGDSGQNLEEYLYRLMLIDWTIDFESGDFGFYKNMDFDVDFDVDFHLSREQCVRLKKEELIEELREQYQKSSRRFLLYQKDKGRNLKVVEKLKPQYPIYLRYIQWFQRNLGDCDVVRVNEFGHDITVWYFIKDKAKIYLISVRDFL